MGTRRERPASRPGRYTPEERETLPIEKTLIEPQRRSGFAGKGNLSSWWQLNPNRQSRSHLLYRLSYRTPLYLVTPVKMFNISIFVLMQSLLYLSITPSAVGRNIFNILGIGKKSSLTPVKEIT
jgi:hypothetical protein